MINNCKPSNILCVFRDWKTGRPFCRFSRTCGNPDIIGRTLHMYITPKLMSSHGADQANQQEVNEGRIYPKSNISSALAQFLVSSVSWGETSACSATKCSAVFPAWLFKRVCLSLWNPVTLPPARRHSSYAVNGCILHAGGKRSWLREPGRSETVKLEAGKPKSLKPEFPRCPTEFRRVTEPVGDNLRVCQNKRDPLLI